jgi:hypothetical protein
MGYCYLSPCLAHTSSTHRCRLPCASALTSLMACFSLPPASTCIYLRCYCFYLPWLVHSSRISHLPSSSAHTSLIGYCHPSSGWALTTGLLPTSIRLSSSIHQGLLPYAFLGSSILHGLFRPSIHLGLHVPHGLWLPFTMLGSCVGHALFPPSNRLG